MAADAYLVEKLESDLCPSCGGPVNRQVTAGDPDDGVVFFYCPSCRAEWRQVPWRRSKSVWKRRGER